MTRFLHLSTLLALLATVGCPYIPPVVVENAKELKNRYNNLYMDMDDNERFQAMMGDAAIACSVDIDEGVEEAASEACKCKRSSLGNYVENCRSWASIPSSGSEEVAMTDSPEEEDAEVSTSEDSDAQ